MQLLRLEKWIAQEKRSKTVKFSHYHVAKLLFCPKINQSSQVNETVLLEYDRFSSKIEITHSAGDGGKADEVNLVGITSVKLL